MGGERSFAPVALYGSRAPKAVILAATAAVPLPRFFSKILPALLTMNVITPLRS